MQRMTHNPFVLPMQTYPPQESPRVTLEVSSFEEWESKAEAFYQTQFGFRCRNQRAVYDMLGQKVFMGTYFPTTIFGHISVRYIAADFTIRSDSDTMKLAARHGGEWEEGYYMDEGFGWPVFNDNDDGLRQCFEFIQQWRQEANVEV